MSNLQRSIDIACEITGTRLSQMCSLDISVSLSSPHDLRIANEWFKRDERLSWGGQSFWERNNFGQFHLSIKKARAVLAVCKSQVDNRDSTITMDCFESRPFDNPLKGRVLEAFTDAHRKISEELDVKRLDVREPNSDALCLLNKIGFDTSGPYPVLPV